MTSKRILSISRRTDIPAFYTPWLINRVKEGFCHVLNPFNQTVIRVSLLPEDVTGIVFWTRNPVPFMKYLEFFNNRGFSYYFNFTITGYGTPLESHTPPLKSAIQMFKKLSEKLSPSRVVWRYDPVIISNMTPVEFHLENFEKIASALSGYTDLSVISFVDLYRKSINRLNSLKESSGLSLAVPDILEIKRLASSLRSIAFKRKIELLVCCEPYLSDVGFTGASCVNPSIFTTSCGNISKHPTRKGCGCSQSVDIGTYSTCLHGCTYCYATVSQKAARTNNEKSDQEDSFLLRPYKYSP